MPEVTEAMITDDSFPVRWARVNETVSLGFEPCQRQP